MSEVLLCAVLSAKKLVKSVNAARNTMAAEKMFAQGVDEKGGCNPTYTTRITSQCSHADIPKVDVLSVDAAGTTLLRIRRIVERCKVTERCSGTRVEEKKRERKVAVVIASGGTFTCSTFMATSSADQSS